MVGCSICPAVLSAKSSTARSQGRMSILTRNNRPNSGKGLRLSYEQIVSGVMARSSIKAADCEASLRTLDSVGGGAMLRDTAVALQNIDVMVVVLIPLSRTTSSIL